MTACCPIGRHPDVDAIDRAIRAQQAASLAGESTRAPSYSQIARTYGLRKATLLDHRDRCLTADAADRGTGRSGVPVGADGVPVRTEGGAIDENANNSARYDRYAESVPAAGTDDARVSEGRGTGPPEGVGQRGPGASEASLSDGAVIGVGQSAPSAGGAHAATSSGSDAREVGQGRPPERSVPAHARAREAHVSPRPAHRWDVVGLNSVDAATERITNAIADSELVDVNDPRAHATYVHEVVELINRMQWENDLTVTRLARAWSKPKMFVLGCYRDACSLMRMARGTPNEDREVSLVRWMNLHKIAVSNGDPISLKVASDALKGYDAAAGIVDKSTRVQVNVMQDPQAQAFLSDVWETLRAFPDAAAALRARLAAKRDAYGELPPVEVVDAAE